MAQSNIISRALSLFGCTFLIVGLGITVVAQDAAVLEREAPKQESETQESEGQKLDQAALKQITYDIKYMSSDEMGGRQPGTPGIKLCEDYIVAEYKKAGLKPLEDGTYFQEMEVGRTRMVDKEKTKLTIKGPNDAKMDMELGKDFQQLLGRRDFDLTSDLVFAGYGITAEEHNYDDYNGIDVKDKIVVIIRYEPQSEDESSVFDGAETSRHASGSAKVTAARRAGAKGLIMVNNGAMSEDEDDLVAEDRFGSNGLPFAQIKRSSFNEILKSSPLVTPTGKKLTKLSEVEKLIDSNLEPISQKLEGWSCEYSSAFPIKKVKTYNIIGIVEGEGPNKDETIVIGCLLYTSDAADE